MALGVNDMVYQLSQTSGTGNITLTAINGRRTFATAFGTGVTTNVFFYFIGASAGSAVDEWEVGLGHMSNSTTLVRDTVIVSSNANAFVNFSGGILDVMNDIPAAYQPVLGVNPACLGVVGNGTTDDSTTFQTAVNTAAAANLPLNIPASMTVLIDSVQLPSNCRIGGKGTIKRKNSGSINAFMWASSQSNISIDGVKIDGNKANQTLGANNLQFSACSQLSVTGVTSNSAKAQSGGYGSGIVMIDCTYVNGVRSNILRCITQSNDLPGILCIRSPYMDINYNVSSSNGGTGINITDDAATPTALSCGFCNIVGNQASSNTGAGIGVGTFRESTNGSGNPRYGFANMPASGMHVSGNKCISNTVYGIAFYAERSVLENNVTISNATATPAAGYNVASIFCTISGNVSDDDGGTFGFDCGASTYCTFTGNTVAYVGRAGSVSSVTGFNLGATRWCLVDGNTIQLNKAGIGISMPATDGDGTTSFPLTGTSTIISNNRILLNGGGTSKGIQVTGPYVNAVVRNNTVFGLTSPMDAFVFYADVKQSDNKYEVNGNMTIAVASAATVVVPDAGDKFYVSGTTNVSNVLSSSQSALSGKVKDVQITNGGSGYTSAPTVSFSGGGGTGAAGTALISNNGTVVGVAMTNLGSGYTSAPTVSFSGGGGTSAAGTALVGVANGIDRVFSLMFSGNLTVTSGANLTVKGATLSATGTTILSLNGSYGAYYEMSRGTS